MHFYASQIDAHGPQKTLDKYVFSKQANLTPDGKQGAQMLDRFMSGLLHPMIHTGHWAEFHVPGMLAEGTHYYLHVFIHARGNHDTTRRIETGLALASTTSPNSTHLFPPDFFDYGAQQPESSAQSIVGHAATVLRNLSLNKPRSSSPSSFTGGSHSLDILHRMLQDPSLAAGKTCKHDSDSSFSDTLQAAGEKIREYAKMWQVDSEREVLEKLEEVAWLATLVYGLGGWRKGKPFRSDFFL